jgi:cbb3-type cytochrome oxidase subunit 3
VFFTWFFFCIGQYLYQRDERKRAQQALSPNSDDEEDKLDREIENKGGEIVEHVERK